MEIDCFKPGQLDNNIGTKPCVCFFPVWLFNSEAIISSFPKRWSKSWLRETTSHEYIIYNRPQTNDTCTLTDRLNQKATF